MPKTINKIPQVTLSTYLNKEIIDRSFKKMKALLSNYGGLTSYSQNWLHLTGMQAYVAENSEPISRIHGVVSLFVFTTTPRGKHTVKFCVGTACYVSGITRLLTRQSRS